MDLVKKLLNIVWYNEPIKIVPLAERKARSAVCVGSQ